MNLIRRGATIVAAAALPAWLLHGAVARLLISGDGFAPRKLLPTALEAAVLTLHVLLSAAIVVLLARRGLFRSDQWWLAGGLFVAASVAATVVVQVPLYGGFVFIDLLQSMFTGTWLVGFTAGALAWRAATPTYVPTEWLRDPDPEDVDQ